MGNCIIRQNKIMQTDQEVSQHKESMQVLLDKNLEPKAETEDGNGIVRIKLVITKQELQVMLTKGGVSVADLVSHMKKEISNDGVVIEDEDNRYCGRWKPVLESIPELN